MDIAFKCSRCHFTYLFVTDDFHLLPTVIGQQLIPRSYNESANPRIDTIEEFIPEFDPQKVPLKIGDLMNLNYFTTLTDAPCD